MFAKIVLCLVQKHGPKENYFQIDWPQDGNHCTCIGVFRSLMNKELRAMFFRFKWFYFNVKKDYCKEIIFDKFILLSLMINSQLI